VSTPSTAPSSSFGPLRDASVSRLACLVRHWIWADEAKRRFERELADGWEYDEDLNADHPFGAYYHWSALLCGLGEAALEQSLLSPRQLEAIRADLDASMPWLISSRRLLVSIPASFEEHPRVVDLMRDTQSLGQLQRLHRAFGDAIREEEVTRQLDVLEA
jgi:hypothetical protein